MALRAVPDHPKFASLKAVLKQPKGATLGWLEALWHFTGRFTPQGNIGKYTDEAIEAWVEWNGEPGMLIGALIHAGWIDRDETYRLLVHDWNQHADKATKNALQRANLTFFVRTLGVQSTNGIPESGTVYRLPEPVPVPVPVVPPLPPSRGGRVTRRQRQASVGSPRSKEAEAADDALHAEQERKSYVMWQGMSEKYKLANPWLGAIPGAEVARSVS